MITNTCLGFYELIDWQCLWKLALRTSGQLKDLSYSFGSGSVNKNMKERKNKLTAHKNVYVRALCILLIHLHFCRKSYTVHRKLKTNDQRMRNTRVAKGQDSGWIFTLNIQLRAGRANKNHKGSTWYFKHLVYLLLPFN